MKQDILQKESVEISVYSDCCTDNTSALLKEWEEKISQTERLSIVISYGDDGPKGGRRIMQLMLRSEKIKKIFYYCLCIS